MANLCKARCTVEWDGSGWLIWVGNVLMLSTKSATELVAATRGKFSAPTVKPERKLREETVDEFLARGGKIRKVKASPLGFEFTEEEIESAIAASRREFASRTPVAAPSGTAGADPVPPPESADATP